MMLNELFLQKDFLFAYLFSGTYRGFGLIEASGGLNAEMTTLVRPYVLDARRYVVKFIVKLKTLPNFEKATTRLHQMTVADLGGGMGGMHTPPPA